MPDFAGSKTQQATGKYICRASRPANTPRQACSLDCIAKLRFAFQSAPAGRHLQHFYLQAFKKPRQSESSFPALPDNQLPPPPTSSHTSFSAFLRPAPPFRRQPAKSLPSYFFTEPQAFRPPAPSIPASAGPALPRRPSFYTSLHNLPPANTLIPA